MSAQLVRLAVLIKQKNTADEEISANTERPATLGQTAEYVAARIFAIRLDESTAGRGSDGEFVDGPLAGHTVNVRWYPLPTGTLELVTRETIPDYYLVLTGLEHGPISSRLSPRPGLISSVHLFAAADLHASLRLRNLTAGIRTTVTPAKWQAAEVYTEDANAELIVSTEQRRDLRLFG